MKKSYIILLSLLLVFMMSATSMAKYEKGDYKVFSLGDTKELIKEKVNYLVITGELVKGNGDYFTTKIAGETFDGYFSYYNDQLYKMSFYSKEYNAMRYDTYLKDLMMDKIKPMFSGSYGEPVNDYGYPSFFNLKDGYTRFISRWRDGDKEIIIGVSSGDFTYEGAILIVDTALEKQKEKDEEDAKKAQAQQSASDF